MYVTALPRPISPARAKRLAMLQASPDNPILNGKNQTN